MEPVRIVTGRAVPLDRSDVDTDQIIPSEWLKRIERTGFGAGLFSEWRDEPSFVLNKPEHSGASILLAGPNSGWKSMISMAAMIRLSPSWPMPSTPPCRPPSSRR